MLGEFEIGDGDIISVQNVITMPDGTRRPGTFRRLAQARVTINEDGATTIVLNLAVKRGVPSSLTIPVTSTPKKERSVALFPRLVTELTPATQDEITAFKKKGGRFSYLR